MLRNNMLLIVILYFTLKIEMKGRKHMKKVANEQITEKQIKKLQEELQIVKFCIITSNGGIYL